MGPITSKIEWKEIVKIQYDAMQRSSALYVAILAAIAVFAKEFSLSSFGTIALVITFFLVLLQNLGVLYLTNVQRQASWKGGNNQRLNEKENRVRKAVLVIAALATLSIITTTTLVLLS